MRFRTHRKAAGALHEALERIDVTLGVGPARAMPESGSADGGVLLFGADDWLMGSKSYIAATRVDGVAEIKVCAAEYVPDALVVP